MLRVSTPRPRPRRWRESAAPFGVEDAARGLYELNVRLGLHTGLKDLGLLEKDLGRAVEVVSAVKIAHPKAVTKADLENVIGQAFAGAPSRF